MKSKRTLIISGITLLVCIIVAAMVMISINSSTARASKELDLGNKFLSEGKYEEAILAFENVIEIDPKNIEARMSLADTYIKTGELEKAQTRLQEVVDIKADYIDGYLKLADVKVLSIVAGVVLLIIMGFFLFRSPDGKATVADNQPNITSTPDVSQTPEQTSMTTSSPASKPTPTETPSPIPTPDSSQGYNNGETDQTSAIRFVDAEFEKMVRIVIGKPTGDIYPSDVDNLKKLRFLYLSENRILSDISAVSSLTNLELLELHGNQIKDISPLAALINLKYLNISYNPITDYAPLKSLKKVEIIQ